MRSHTTPLIAAVALVFGCASPAAESEPECVYDGQGAIPTGWGIAVPVGVVRAGSVEIDYSGGSARIGMSHERDVDEAEDGCVQQVAIEIENANGGCDLDLWYDPNLRVTTLRIDDDCPGWDDSDEGEYKNTRDGGPALDGVERVTGNVSQACFETVLQLQGTVVVEDYNEVELTLDLSGLRVEGAASSGGDREFGGAACPFE